MRESHSSGANPNPNPDDLPLQVFEALGLLHGNPALLLAPAVVALLGDLSIFADERQALALCHLDLDLPQLRDDLLRPPVLRCPSLALSVRVNSLSQPGLKRASQVRGAGLVGAVEHRTDMSS